MSQFGTVVLLAVIVWCAIWEAWAVGKMLE